MSDVYTTDIETILDNSDLSAYCSGDIKKARKLLEEHGFDVANMRTYDENGCRFSDIVYFQGEDANKVTYCWVERRKTGPFRPCFLFPK